MENEPAFSANLLQSAIQNGEIPNFPKRKKSWSALEVPQVGQKFGFIKKPKQPLVICSFVTKGGVFKTSLTLNLARLAALHNIKTCVVGLDMQGDITSALGFNRELEDEDNLDTALNKIAAIKGLPDLFSKKLELEDLIQQTDLPSLSFIPETPELVNLERSISLSHNREHWLNNQVIEPLKEKFDLIILDASPNWNLLITNALVSCDLLLSPLECKINNFRNFQVFDVFIKEFKRELALKFSHLYIPTRWQKQRKLSMEILEWYREHISNCSKYSIPESTQGEESSAMSLSVAEYSPGTPLALSYNKLVYEIFNLAKAKRLTEDSPNITSIYKEDQNGLKP